MESIFYSLVLMKVKVGSALSYKKKSSFIRLGAELRVIFCRILFFIHSIQSSASWVGVFTLVWALGLWPTVCLLWLRLFLFSPPQLSFTNPLIVLPEAPWSFMWVHNIHFHTLDCLPGVENLVKVSMPTSKILKCVFFFWGGILDQLIKIYLSKVVGTWYKASFC